ncbi:MAG: type II toxin-antitoxin system HicA family toxin [Bdellovibrionota bacterium]
MKKRELEKRLKRLGWYLLRQGSRHEIWTNGSEQEAVPRHTEISEVLSAKILRTAKRYPRS